jgi:hypothetical protein
MPFMEGITPPLHQTPVDNEIIVMAKKEKKLSLFRPARVMFMTLSQVASRVPLVTAIDPFAEKIFHGKPLQSPLREGWKALGKRTAIYAGVGAEQPTH